MIHELVEVYELKRMGISIGWETAVRYPSKAYEAHLTAAEVEFSIAGEEGDQGWLERRLRDAECWLRGPQLPPSSQAGLREVDR